MAMKHAVITGGSSGIGRAIAQRLWQRGYHLTLMARTPELLAEAKASFLELPHEASQTILTLSVDVSQRQQVTDAFEQSLDRIGPIELLINSAGTAVPGDFLAQPLAVSEATMAVNFFGSLYSAYAVLPNMARRGRGQLVFISSGVGLIGLYGYASYCPSKFAVRGLAESLRAEMKPLGIAVSIVYPPDTDTPQLEQENQTKPLVTQRLSSSAQVLSAEQV
ncbi:MAG: SDR family oxidoreductase, partial [Cyanobacteria bacterium P01_F01_bin.42]